jgi:hypothetical protein
MQDDTKRSHCFVSAASEKYFENVHPPIEMSTFQVRVLILERLQLLEVSQERP